MGKAKKKKNNAQAKHKHKLNININAQHVYNNCYELRSIKYNSKTSMAKENMKQEVFNKELTITS